MRWKDYWNEAKWNESLTYCFNVNHFSIWTSQTKSEKIIESNVQVLNTLVKFLSISISMNVRIFIKCNKITWITVLHFSPKTIKNDKCYSNCHWSTLNISLRPMSCAHETKFSYKKILYNVYVNTCIFNRHFNRHYLLKTITNLAGCGWSKIVKKEIGVCYTDNMRIRHLNFCFLFSFFFEAIKTETTLTRP